MSAGRIPTTANSPLTVKGDLFTFSTGSAKLAVGANNTVLTADSAEASGLKWATPAAGLTMITSQSFTAVSSVNVNNCFSATYERYLLMFKYAGASASLTTFLKFRVSGTDLSANYYYTAASVGITGPTQVLIAGNNASTGFDLGAGSQTPNFNTAIVNVQYPFVNNTQCDVHYSVASLGQSTTSMQKYATGGHNNTASGIIDGFSLLFSGNNTGEVIIYGYTN